MNFFTKKNPPKIPEPVWFVQKWLDTSPTLATLGPSSHSEPAPTSAPSTGCLLLLTLWMNLNSVNIWFHLGKQFCRKTGLI